MAIVTYSRNNNVKLGEKGYRVRVNDELWGYAVGKRTNSNLFDNWTLTQARTEKVYHFTSKALITKFLEGIATE